MVVAVGRGRLVGRKAFGPSAGWKSVKGVERGLVVTGREPTCTIGMFSL